MSCATIPTETQFQVVTTTSNSLSTSFSIQVTTQPPTTITSTVDCSLSSSISSCSPTTFVVTNAGSTSTNTIPVTFTVPVTVTSSSPTRTLFSTSCSSSSTSTSSTSSTSSSTTLTSQSSSSTPASSSSSSPISTSPSPFLVSSSVATNTLSNGSAVTTQVIVMTTSSPPSVVVTPSPSLNQNGTGGGNSSSNTAPIIGGTVGGVIGVLALIAVIWYIRRRSKRWNDIFEKEHEEESRRPRMSLGGEDVQPKPYHYGLVGYSSSPSPPGSPPLRTAEPGHSPSNSLSLLNPPTQHSRSSSGVALSSPASMNRSLSDLGPANATRPSLSTVSSAAASIRPLLERPVNYSRTNPNLLGVGVSQQHVPLSPRPNSAGGSLQSASPQLPSASTVPALRPHTAPTSEKRRLLASLPQGAAAPTPPSIAIESGSSPEQVPHTESRLPPIRQRNPNRPSSSKSSNVVTVHVDGGPAAENAQPSRPEGNEPPAYSPT